MPKITTKPRSGELIRRDVKTEIRALDGDGSEFAFICSTDTEDRYGDVIEQNWELRNFKNNPIALFNHDADQIIGSWRDVHVDSKGRLRGILRMAMEGTSALVDAVRSLLQQGIIRAVSVGFLPIEWEPLNRKDPSAGIRFTRSELMEISAVSIPANPEAISVARSLGISAETRARLFSTETGARRAPTVHAKAGVSPKRAAQKGSTMPAIDEEQPRDTSSLIRKLQRKADRAQVEIDQIDAAVLEAEGEMDDEQRQRKDELTAEMNDALSRVKNLEAIEQGRGKAAHRAAQERADAHDADEQISRSATRAPTILRGPAPVTGDKKAARQTAIRFLAAGLHSAMRGNGGDIEWSAKQLFEKDSRLHTVIRAAQDPALTTNDPFAGSLVGETVMALMEAMAVDGALAKLVRRGPNATFGPGVGSATIPIEAPVPTDGTMPTAAGTHFGEAGRPNPIRVGSFSLAEITLTPKEVGVILAYSQKMLRYSSVDLEAFIERVVIRHTTAQLDNILLSTGASSAVVPPGLAAAAHSPDVTAFSPAGATPTVGEIETAIGAAIDALSGSIDPVLIIHTETLEKLSRIRTATGVKAFAEDIAGGRLMGKPIISHKTGAMGEIYGTDAARFASAVGSPVFDTTGVATLHMENAPGSVAAITTGAGPTVATPVQSLFQTASRATRMIMDASWAVGGAVSQITDFDL